MTEPTFIFTIPEGIIDMRIDKAVALETHLSRSTIAELFDEKKIQLDGKDVKRSEKVNPGNVVTVEYVDKTDEPVEGQDIPLDIVFQDEYIVVINKPDSLVVHPGAGNPDGTVANALVFLFPEIATVGELHRPGIVHRLDAGTSGLMVAAKTQEAYEHFVEMFSTHDVQRDYVALVWGRMETTSGIIDAPIGRSQTRVTQMAVRDDGKYARTHYSLREYYPAKEVSLLDISLETGRTHQIRVHCAAIDHPIVGDKTYGGYRQSIDCPRPFLHAHTLRFVHPITGEDLEFSVPIPEDLMSVLSEVDVED